MSQENVELMRRGAEAWMRGDLSTMLELMSDDLVTYRAHPDAATYHGKEGYLQLTMDWIEGFAEWSATPEEFIDAGDSVVVHLHQTARGEASGVWVESDWWFVHTIASGKVVRLEMFNDKHQALEAAGVRE